MGVAGGDDTQLQAGLAFAVAAVESCFTTSTRQEMLDAACFLFYVQLGRPTI